MSTAGGEACIRFFGSERIIATHGKNRDARIPHIRSDASGETVYRIFARNNRQHRLRMCGKARGDCERAGGSGYGQRCILAASSFS